MTVETRISHFNLVVEGYKFTTEDIWNVVVAASAQGLALREITALELQIVLEVLQ